MKPTINNKFAVGFAGLSLIGFADTAYLTAKHFLGEIPPCTITGCEAVLTSTYSEILGIPLSLFGAIYYLTILILSVLYLDKRNSTFLEITSKFTAVGFITSIVLVYLQLYVIKAICQYCMISASTSTLLFLLGSYYIFTQNKPKK